MRAAEPLADALFDLVVRQRVGPQLRDVETADVDAVRRAAVDDEIRIPGGGFLHGGDERLGKPVRFGEPLGRLARFGRGGQGEHERHLHHAVPLAVAVGTDQFGLGGMHVSLSPSRARRGTGSGKSAPWRRRRRSPCRRRALRLTSAKAPLATASQIVSRSTSREQIVRLAEHLLARASRRCRRASTPPRRRGAAPC